MRIELTPNDLIDLAGGRGDPVLRGVIAAQEKDIKGLADRLLETIDRVESLLRAVSHQQERIAALTEETAAWEVRIRDLEQRGHGPAAAAVPA